MKKIWANFIKSGKDVYEGLNFAEIAARVPPNQKTQYMAFLKRNQMYRERMMKYPRYLPKIDWDFYRANVRESYRDWVDDYEKQYDKLNQIFDSRHEMMDMTLYYKEIDEEQEELQKEIEDFQRESCARMEKYEKEKERVENLLDFTDMTWEDYCYAYPNEAPDYLKKPTFWPHTPDEQTPGPSGIHTIEEDNKESDSKKPSGDGKPSKPKGGSTPAAPSGKSSSDAKGEAKSSTAKDEKAPKAMATFTDVSGESKQSVISIFTDEAKPMEAKFENEVYGKVVIVSEEESIFKTIQVPKPIFKPATEEHKVQEISSENELQSTTAYKINIDKSSSDIVDHLIGNKEIDHSKELKVKMAVENAEFVSQPDEVPKSQATSVEQVSITEFKEPQIDITEPKSQEASVEQVCITESKEPQIDITDPKSQEASVEQVCITESESDSRIDPSVSKKMLEEMKETFTKSQDFDPLMGHESLKVFPKQMDDLAQKESIKALLPKLDEFTAPQMGMDTTITSMAPHNEDPNQIIPNKTLIRQNESETEGPKLDLKLSELKSDSDVKPLPDDVKVESSPDADDKYDITIVKGSSDQEPTTSEITNANAELVQAISELDKGFDIKSSQDNEGDNEQTTNEDKKSWGLIGDEKYTKGFEEVARNVSHLLEIANKSLAAAKIVHKDKLKALEAITKETSKAAERASKEAEKALKSARKLLKRAKAGNVELDEKTISMAKQHAMLAQSLAERALELKKETVKVLNEIEKRQQEQSKPPEP